MHISGEFESRATRCLGTMSDVGPLYEQGHKTDKHAAASHSEHAQRAEVSGSTWCTQQSAAYTVVHHHNYQR